ncbi:MULTISPECIES: hypothetical protein [unclassified Streptomyces]|uniref:hypothetical protein n=1 Tax=unclassified Streptomyces TaxID=2593676 RepID=UPI002E0E543D|nr:MULTISPECIES: hypothetical protein [unclassified Streptomyces]WSR26524.1 hypothetical protein OG573_10530 [Streptomyces sp. NBC_01205]
MVAGRRIRFTAVLVAVVFALTGFSSHGHGSKSSGSGGGCSGSKKRSSYDSNNSNTNNSNGSGKSTPSPSKSAGPPAHAQVVTCAGPGSPKAVLKVTSDVDTARLIDVPVVFQGASGVVERTSVRVSLKARETQTVTAAMVQKDKAAEVTGCALGTIN